ncbi:DUF2637 domain-containing protein [Spirillospora sp. NPDC047279]|uniref:DUF2637 domain-containing protein n=1 Tax=Spirillospora sp. NPDC047279 TaxID=3155478 RepID=UPI0033C7D1AC
MSTLHELPATDVDVEASFLAMEAESTPDLPGRPALVVKVVGIVVTPMIAALAVLGGIGSFTTVEKMAEPYFGSLAWIVPVGMDVGILVLLMWDLLMEYLNLPWPVLRWVAWAYVAGTVLVNVIAAHGELAGSVMHAAMPVLFVTVIEGVRHLIRRWIGLSTGRRVERVPVARWMLAPVSSFLLWRRMVLWHITSYRQGLHLEYRHLLAVSCLREEHGRWTWRWKAPLSERMALRRLPGGVVEEAVSETFTPNHEIAPSYAEEAETTACCGDAELMDAAWQIHQEADGQERRLSRDELGWRLRELGFTVSNERLTEVISAIRGDTAAKGEA